MRSKQHKQQTEKLTAWPALGSIAEANTAADASLGISGPEQHGLFVSTPTIYYVWSFCSSGDRRPTGCKLVPRGKSSKLRIPDYNHLLRLIPLSSPIQRAVSR